MAAQKVAGLGAGSRYKGQHAAKGVLMGGRRCDGGCLLVVRGAKAGAWRAEALSSLVAVVRSWATRGRLTLSQLVGPCTDVVVKYVG